MSDDRYPLVGHDELVRQARVEALRENRASLVAAERANNPALAALKWMMICSFVVTAICFFTAPSATSELAYEAAVAFGGFGLLVGVISLIALLAVKAVLWDR